ncbi:unnamed protein product [Schistosoma spindalis]|nr:unnamed protein product [Schistosoma spindale]
MNNLCYIYGIAIGFIGIIASIIHLFICIIWIAYLFGWQLNQQKNSYKNYNLQLNWPKCSLRFSIKIYILLMIISSLLIYLIDGIRLIYLCFTWIDLRIIYNEWYCKCHILLKNFSMDLYNWIFALICLERLTLIIFTNPKYLSIINSKKIFFIQLLIVFLFTLFTCSVFLISIKSICDQYFYNRDLIYSRFLLSSFLPAIISIISSCYIIRICYKQEIKLNTTRKLINLPGERLIGLSIKSVNKIIAAKTTLLSACILPIFHIILFIFMLNNKNYCCYFTFNKQLNIEDYFYVSFDLIFCILYTLKLHLFIVSSPSINRNICIIITLIKIRIRICCCCGCCSSSCSCCSSSWIQPMK